jgi:hypothetical protein
MELSLSILAYGSGCGIGISGYSFIRIGQPSINRQLAHAIPIKSPLAEHDARGRWTRSRMIELYLVRFYLFVKGVWLLSTGA